MATFVLVHAAWGGAWEWRTVARRLQSLGHEVFTPTLTGVGERSHLLAPDITLDTHIQDVVNAIEFEDLTEVVLTGQSSSGVVITGVADKIPERIAHLVYIDTPVPTDGQSLTDLLPSELVERIRNGAKAAGDGWKIPVPFESGDELGMPADVASWYFPRLAPFHPLRTMEDKVRLTRAQDVPRTFVLCTEHPLTEMLRPFAERAKSEGWGYHELETGHDPQILDPDGLAAVLDAITRD